MPKKFVVLEKEVTEYICDITGVDIKPEEIYMQQGQNIISKKGYDMLPEAVRKSEELTWLIIRSLNADQMPQCKIHTEYIETLKKGIYALVFTKNKSWWAYKKDACYEWGMKRFFDLEECREFLNEHCCHLLTGARYIIFQDGCPIMSGISVAYIPKQESEL